MLLKPTIPSAKLQEVCRLFSHYTPQVLFNDENRRKCVQKFQSMMPIKARTKSRRTAAVLIPLCLHNDQVSLIYTLRAAHLNSHRGQVSFPGGMRDENDSSLEFTALRETYEELGIPTEDFEIWGSGNLIVTKQEMSVLPVIGCLKHDLSLDNLVLSDSEVEEVFTVPIQRLCQSGVNRHTQFRNSYSTPVFLGGHRRIWGLTAIITHLFLKSLLPNKAYDHKIVYLPNVLSSR